MSEQVRGGTARSSVVARALSWTALYCGLAFFAVVESWLMLAPHFPPHNAQMFSMEKLAPFLWPLAVGAVVLVPVAWLSRRLASFPAPLVGLLLVAVVSRASYLALRVSFADMAVDNDVVLVFGYAEQLAQGTYPQMEYPQVALLYFWAAYRLAGGVLESFRIVLPLLNLVCDMLVIACIWGMGSRAQAKQSAWILALCVAVSPFGLILWFSKFDALPAALFALGIYLFAIRREELSGVALAVGFFAKWFPAVAAPILWLHLLRRGQWLALVRFSVALAVIAAAIGLPFWLADSERFLFTYRFHADRGAMGESIFYLPVYWLEPQQRLAAGRLPWDGFSSDIFTVARMWWIQFGAIGLLGLGALAFRGSRLHAAKLACLAVLAFIVLNRVFSPQYAIVMVSAYSMALSTRPLPPAALAALALAYLGLTAANMFVWPFFASFWVESSLLFFSLSLLLAAAVVVTAVVPRAAAAWRRGEAVLDR